MPIFGRSRRFFFGAPTFAGLVADFHAALGIAFNVSTGRVSGWADQSGNGYDLINATSALQPAYSSADTSFNNLPAVNFDTANRGLYTSSITFPLGPFTIIQNVNLSSANGYLACHDTTATAKTYLFNGVSSTIYVERSGGIATRNAASSTWAQSGTKTIVYRFDGTNVISLRVNGSALTLSTGASGTPGNQVISKRMYLFCGTDTASNYVIGKCADFTVYNVALSDTDVQEIEDSYRQIYGHW